MTEEHIPDNSKIEEYSFVGTGLTNSEKRWGGKRFKDYKKHYNITSLSDLQLLESLVYREALQERCRKKIGKLANNKKSKEDLLPYGILKTLDENEERILILKEKLGLFSENKGEEPFKYIQQLKKKAEIHRKNNKGDYTIPCPFCQQLIYLKFKTKYYDAIEHPWFRGRFLTNDELWKCYKDGKPITKERLANILGVANDYIDFLEDKLYSDKPSKVPTD